MFRLPAPTGPYPVGTSILYLVDASRPEIHPNPPGSKRELMVQVWYPAEPSTAPLAPYRRWVDTTKVSSYMALLKTHSRQDAPVSRSGAPFPVLLFNPAWDNQRTQNTYQTEDLASHGFVVIGIDHTYNSQPVVFPDGRRVLALAGADMPDFAHLTLAQELSKDDAEANYEAADDIFVLNAFAQMNQDPRSVLYGKLDVDRSGAFGHSFGGGVSMEACREDPRIRAAMNMDGWIFGDVARDGLDKPVMLMYTGIALPSQAELNSSNVVERRVAELNTYDIHNIYATLNRFGGFLVVFRKSFPLSHMNFSDRALYSPIRRLAESGPVDPRRAHQIIEAYTLAFFSQALKRDAQPILAPGAKPFAETSLEVWKSGDRPSKQ